MKLENIQTWIQNLRSGEYKQGITGLHTKTQNISLFCCMGVFCDVLRPDNGEWAWNGVWETDDDIQGWNDELPDDVFEEYTGLPAQAQHYFVFLNDDERETFSFIADEVEKMVSTRTVPAFTPVGGSAFSEVKF